MNTLLKIQIKVLAREAQQVLRSMSAQMGALNRTMNSRAGNNNPMAKLTQGARLSQAEINKLNRGMLQLADRGVFTELGNEAARFNTRLNAINERIGTIGRTAQQTWKLTPNAPSSRFTQGKGEEIAARQAAAAAATIAKQQQAMMKQIWRQQVADAKIAKLQEVQVSRSAANDIKQAQIKQAQSARQEAERTKRYLKQIWDEQVRHAKKALKDEVAAFRKAKHDETEAARRAAHQAEQAQRNTFMSRASRFFVGEMSIQNQGMLQFGKNLQWVGRQINFNFTIPLLYAGKVALGWVMDNERAFTRLKKVYNDTSSSATADLEKIRHGMRLLSDIFGVTQDQVIELGAAWAATGLTGSALLKNVQTSLELAILGDYSNVTDTFEDLIAIQSAYQLSSGELAAVIANLNTVENTTAANLPDLTTGMAKAGSAAHVAGVSYKELAAMLAVLVPATGSAATAGNALKTVFSRLMAPTQDIIDLLGEMNINFYDTDFQMLTATGRLQELADKWGTLTDAQRANLASVVGSRFQFNKLVALLDDMSRANGVYAQTLERISDANAAGNVAEATREIAILLKSDPRRFEILMTQMKNMISEVLIPALPVLINFVAMLREVVEWFTSLSPSTQKWILALAGLTIVIGVASQAIGSIMLVIATFGKFILGFVQWFVLLVGFILKAIGVLLRATRLFGLIAPLMTNPYAIAIAVIIALLVLFIIFWGDEFVEGVKIGVKLIAKFVMKLPEIWWKALKGVIDVIAAAITVIIDLLSYLNPFARHSPSLVDNVKAGVRIIAAEYASLGEVGGVFARAARDLDTFRRATDAAVRANKDRKRGEDRVSVVSQSGEGAGSALDALYGDLDILRPELEAVTAAVDAQQTVVDALQDQYDAASDAISNFKNNMEPLEDRVSSLREQIDTANDAIQDFAKSPIVGMRDMEDQIFANEMAQKRLRLEILKMEEAGKSYEDIKSKIAAIDGDIEQLRAKMTTLRQAGAGSDILSVYQNEIAALEAQKDGLNASAVNAKELEDRLADLQRQGEILDLEKSLKFDVMQRQIEQLVDDSKELTFEEIVNGIKAQQESVSKLTAEYDKATEELEKQKKVLKEMEKARDDMGNQLDDEKDKLKELQRVQKKYQDQIEDIESAIADVVNQLKEANNAAQDAGGAFDDLAGDFEDAASGISSAYDQTLDEMIEEYTKMLDKTFEDPFKEIKEKWKSFVAFIKEKVQQIKDFFVGMWDGMVDAWHGVAAKLDSLWELFKAGVGLAMDFIGERWDTGLSVAGEVLDLFGAGVDAAWELIYETVSGWLEDIYTAVTNAPSMIWNGLSDLGSKVGGRFSDAFTGAKNWVTTTFDDITDQATGLSVRITSGLGNLASTVGEPFRTGFGAAKKWATDTFDDIVDAAMKLPGRLGEFATSLFSAGWKIGDSIVQGIADGVTSLVSTGLGIAESLANGVIGFFNTNVIDRINDLLEFTVSIPTSPITSITMNVDPPDIKHIPEFHKGGYVNPLNGNEQMALLKAGEFVFTPAQVRALARVGVVANRMSDQGDSTRSVGSTTTRNTTINFTGDLSFPNITDPDDAEAFISNLESLAGV